MRCCDKDRTTADVSAQENSATGQGGNAGSAGDRARRPTCWAGAPQRDRDWNLLHPQSQGLEPHVLGRLAGTRRGLEPAPPPVPGPGAPRAGQARWDETVEK